MGLVKCINGHIYDDNNVQACPYCGETNKEIFFRDMPNNNPFNIDANSNPAGTNNTITGINNTIKDKNNTLADKKGVRINFDNNNKKKWLIPAILGGYVVILAVIIVIVMNKKPAKSSNDNDLADKQAKMETPVPTLEPSQAPTQAPTKESANTSNKKNSKSGKFTAIHSNNINNEGLFCIYYKGNEQMMLLCNSQGSGLKCVKTRTQEVRVIDKSRYLSCINYDDDNLYYLSGNTATYANLNDDQPVPQSIEGMKDYGYKLLWANVKECVAIIDGGEYDMHLCHYSFENDEFSIGPKVGNVRAVTIQGGYVYYITQDDSGAKVCRNRLGEMAEDDNEVVLDFGDSNAIGILLADEEHIYCIKHKYDEETEKIEYYKIYEIDTKNFECIETKIECDEQLNTATICDNKILIALKKNGAAKLYSIPLNELGNTYSLEDLDAIYETDRDYIWNISTCYDEILFFEEYKEDANDKSKYNFSRITLMDITDPDSAAHSGE